MQDLSKAFNLPSYFGVTPDNINDKPRLADLLEKKHLLFYDGVAYLKDMQLGIDLSLVEQVILMGFGHTTQSFLSLLASKKKYSIEDYLN